MMTPVNRRDVTHVVENMRLADRDEIYPLRHDGRGAKSIVNEIMNEPTRAWLFRTGPECGPVAVLGAFLDDDSWDVFMLATDQFPAIAHQMTEFIRSSMIPRLAATGIRHAHCLSLASRTDAHRWLALLGAEPETTLRGLGRNGEDYIRFVWRGRHVLLEQQAPQRQFSGNRAA